MWTDMHAHIYSNNNYNLVLPTFLAENNFFSVLIKHIVIDKNDLFKITISIYVIIDFQCIA